MAAKINQILLSIQGTQRWEQQVAFISQLPISQNTAKQLNSTKNAVIIKTLLENPRSKVVTTTCQFLIQIIEKYSPLMHNFVANLIGTDVVFRLLNSSNKILWSSINQLIKLMVMTCGNQKFYTIFGQHMPSKNGQVRQCISGYILVLADMIQMPNKLINNIKNWKNDANKIVRENAHKLQQILRQKNKNTRKNHINKQNNIVTQYHIQQKKDVITKKVPMSQNSQIIMESFIKPDNQFSQLHLDQQSNMDFLITKIHSDQTWSLKVYAIQQLYAIFQSNLERKQDKFFQKILVIFMELLDLKKSKVYIAMGNIIKKAILRQPQMFDKFMDKNFSIFVEKAGRNQQFGYDLISMTVNLEPTKYIIKLAQSSVDIKSTKQKTLLLDILVEKVCAHALPTSKISSLLKLICRHIEKYSTHKQIYLPCLAILSQIKQAYPNQFLSCLLCQQKDILSKIIKIAENVDPRLRQAIINYIHSLKGNKNDKYQKKQERQKNQSATVENQQFRVLINEVSNNEENSVTKLVQYVFQQKKHVTMKQFYEIIKLTEKVVQKNSLVQLQLLLQEICKSQNQKFLQALFQAISTCNGNTIESQYILAYLRKVSTIFKTCSWFMSPNYIDKLISIYRFSKCPKIRLICIKTLSLFPNNLIQTHVNIKQKKLIQFQQKALT